MAKALMIQGTGSGAGKSVVAAGLCRILKNMGIRVAPFKAQNMALNSFLTKEGGEIGRAQALQAEAAGIEPCNDINPILLKATSPSGCQVILNGKVYANMDAKNYYAFRDEAWETVAKAYDRLSEKYDVIVIEGAGSPAEINLLEKEVVNMSVARYANAPVVLVGDIDKGGVFASLYGTIELLKNPPLPPFVKAMARRGGMGGLQKSDADYIKAFIINKFRGDIEILRPGLRMIEDKTGRPVIGVIPHAGNLGLHEEDGVSLEAKGQGGKDSGIKIIVLRLQYISNFTDFDPFAYEPDVELIYSLRQEDIGSADLIIIPGSKNTVSDLLHLRENGIEDCLKAAVKKGAPLIGICGGYQMLGKKILDPYNIESTQKDVDGMCLLDITTTLNKTKTTCHVEAEIVRSQESGVRSNSIFRFLTHNSPASLSEAGRAELLTLNSLRGYEIHMGATTGDIGLFRLSRLTSHDSRFTAVIDGSLNGNVWGTYIHGLFDNDNFRNALLNSLRNKKGLPLQKEIINCSACKEAAIDKWADVLRNNIDICFILKLLGAEYCEQYQKSIL
ncbi:MAG: cobyric acid synthase [Nitrospirae bacterium]|nr:cobyric acid synthase [Nitrospirota bacterium]